MAASMNALHVAEIIQNEILPAYRNAFRHAFLSPARLNVCVSVFVALRRVDKHVSHAYRGEFVRASERKQKLRLWMTFCQRETRHSWW